MTAPSDFLELHRLDDDGNPNHTRIEEQWDEPGCDWCGGKPTVNEMDLCQKCQDEVDKYVDTILVIR